MTIDPASARDLDDALSVTPNDDGTIEVGVHIADVSFYVTAGSELDSYARFAIRSMRCALMDAGTVQRVSISCKNAFPCCRRCSARTCAASTLVSRALPTL